jgi:nucleosome binding factor SPN SPT16 subunit
LALKEIRKLKKKAENRELEFTKDWVNTRKKKMSYLFEREACPTHVFKKVFLREGIEKNFRVVNGAE